MINIRTLKKLNNNDGLTLKNGKAITYKSGWQVATHGIETSDINEAMKQIRACGGNCGVWLSEGIFYIDYSFRVSTKKEALEIGRRHNQISILNWKTMGLAKLNPNFSTFSRTFVRFSPPPTRVLYNTKQKSPTEHLF